MPTVYEFEGNLVRKVERTVSEVGRVSDLLPTLFTYHPITVGRLPKDTQYYSALPQEGSDRVDAHVIVVQPPQIREVLFNESGGGNETQQAYRLAMPYMGFWFNMRGSPINTGGEPNSMVWAPRAWGIFWSRRPFEGTDVDAHARSAMLPNSWPDTRVCFGNNPISGALTLGAHIDRLINTYWTSVFNTDLDVYTPYGSRRGSARIQLDRWATESAANSDVWMNWNIWDGNESRIDHLIESVSGMDAFLQPAPDSTEPVIPTPPIVNTWFGIRNWLENSLDGDQRARMKQALDSFDG
jgi:hypothetical protein